MAKSAMTYNLTIGTRDADASMSNLISRLESAGLQLPDDARYAVRDWLKSLMSIEDSAVHALRSIVDMPHVTSPDFAARNLHGCVGAERCPPCRAKQALRRLEEA